jgi:hypothetical protein
MANINKNHAFPSEYEVDTLHHLANNRYIKNIEKGLSKREYFASKAIQGLLSNDKIQINDKLHIENLVKNSILIADILIENLNN